jgi:hypothetical protein
MFASFFIAQKSRQANSLQSGVAASIAEEPGTGLRLRVPG